MILGLAVCAAVFYAGSAFLAWRNHPRLALVAAVGLGLHFAALALQLTAGGVLRIGVSEAMSLFAWQAALLLWAFCWREAVQVQGVAVYPVAGLVAVWAAGWPSAVGEVGIADPRIRIHVLLSLLSAGLLTLAAVHAIALAVQDRLLHARSLSTTADRFPPLQTMERLLFQMVAVGFVLLSLTLLSGLWFVADWLKQHLAHKTVLSISAWLIFGVLLWGRRQYGWRGRTAIRWTLAGYAVMIIAYFGSKLVLEQMLGTQWQAPAV